MSRNTALALAMELLPRAAASAMAYVASHCKHRPYISARALIIRPLPARQTHISYIFGIFIPSISLFEFSGSVEKRKASVL